MRVDWDDRARENARWYIASDVGDDDQFVASGRFDVEFALRGVNSKWLGQCTALEIGCGTGRMSEFLAPRLQRLFAIDVSVEMVARARQRLGHLSNLRIEETNGTDLRNYDDESFDFVFSYVVFQHIPKHVVRRYFSEARRVLRYGGIFRGQVAHVDNQPDIPDDDTFTMRSWTVDDTYSELADWRCAAIEVVDVAPGTQHLWFTATP